MIGQNDRSETTVLVYGHGQSKNPFYKKTNALKANTNGCSLILSTAVSRGQRLLLINTQHDPMEAKIVKTRALSGQLLEVEVSFPAPRPDFWQ